MKRFGMVLLAVMTLYVVAVRPATAQSGTRLHVGAGLVLPMSDWGDEAVIGDKMGFNAGVGASFGLGTAPVRLRVDASWTQTAHDGVDGNTRLLTGMVNVIYPFQTAGTLRPYIIGGLGLTSTKLSAGGSDTSKTGINFGAGGGVSFAMSSANLFVEARYLSTKAFDLTFAQLPITVGLSFPLGGKK